MTAFDRSDCLRAVEALEPCDVMTVARHIGAAWSQRSTVRNYLNDLVHAGDLIVDRDRRPMLFALNHLAGHRPPSVLPDGTEVYALDDRPLEMNGETWITLCPEDSHDDRLWEFSTTTGRVIQTMEDDS